ncbi:heat shock protein 67B1 [Tachysurus ichikawai]
MEVTSTKSTVMKDETKMCHEAASHPPGYGWQPSLLYNQHFGLPPFLDFRDLSWMESIFRKLRTSSWSGYTQASGIAPKFHRELCGGVSEVLAQQSRWTVSLDVNHFAPSEIIVRTQSGFLEIEGKHDERQDEHGYISRSFLRKYKLPAGIEAESIRSFVTGDGVLTVEATLPNIVPPADVTIPVQVEIKAELLEVQKQDGCQPGVPEVADAVVPPPAEKLEGDTEGADERIHHTDGQPDAPESVEEGEKSITSLIDGEMKDEESVERVDSAGAKDEVLDSKPEAPEAEAPEFLEETVISEKESEIQEKEEDKEIQEAKVEGVLPSAEAEEESPISGRTQEEIPAKDTQAVEQMEQIK